MVFLPPKTRAGNGGKGRLLLERGFALAGTWKGRGELWRRLCAFPGLGNRSFSKKGCLGNGEENEIGTRVQVPQAVYVS